MAEHRRDPVRKNGAQLLRHIRVQSLDELKTRILKGVAEIKAAPVVHRWKNFEAFADDWLGYILMKRYTSGLSQPDR